jgi:hypothetical protein
MCNIYNLVAVIYYRCNSSKGCLAISHAVLKLALKALISLNNVILEVVAVICKHSTIILKTGVTSRVLNSAPTSCGWCVRLLYWEGTAVIS